MIFYVCNRELDCCTHPNCQDICFHTTIYDKARYKGVKDLPMDEDDAEKHLGKDFKKLMTQSGEIIYVEEVVKWPN